MERQQRVQRSKRPGQPSARRLNIAVTGGNAKYTADQQKFTSAILAPLKPVDREEPLPYPVEGQAQ
jgi:hypothetical protein